MLKELVPVENSNQNTFGANVVMLEKFQEKHQSDDPLRQLSENLLEFLQQRAPVVNQTAWFGL